jgi:hypothetical protein
MALNRNGIAALCGCSVAAMVSQAARASQHLSMLHMSSEESSAPGWSATLNLTTAGTSQIVLPDVLGARKPGAHAAGVCRGWATSAV